MYYKLEINHKGHNLTIDGYNAKDRLSIAHIYLSGTEIEISKGLTSYQFDELKEQLSEQLKSK